jgi:hypothetical protein
VTNLATQHAYFATLHLGTRVLMQVGRHWMLAGSCPPGLPPGQTVQRPNLGPCTEWPLAWLPALRCDLKAAGIGHQIVSQTGHFKTGFKQRTLTHLWLALPPSPPFVFQPPPNVAKV